jgi:outer membrane murein-binding lipoprotein Lpp
MDEGQDREEVRRRNATLARRIRAGIVSAGVVGSLGFAGLAGAAAPDDIAGPAQDVTAQVDSPAVDGAQADEQTDGPCGDDGVISGQQPSGGS